MAEKFLLDSSLLAADVLVCGKLGCLVQMVGKVKWIRSSLKHLPLSTRIVLLILTVSLTFVGATKTNRTGSVSSPWGTSSSLSRIDNRSVGATNALKQTNGGTTDTVRFLDIGVATNGTNRYGSAYDSIGNRQWASANAVTNAYVANNLNQYTSILSGSATLREPTYDADGNLTNDCTVACAYDAENRLVSAYPLAPVAGSWEANASRETSCILRSGRESVTDRS